ncbi:hypothetical protein SCUP515_11934 [Seiridium cupressi]
MALSIFNQFHKQGPKAIETAAEALAKHITTSTDQQDALASTQWDILNFSYKNPQAIDYLLRVYYYMSSILPPEPEDIGEAVVERDWDYDGTEYANATFTRDEVTGGLDTVLDKIRNVREQRMKTVVAWTVEARAHALGVAKAGTGEQAHLPMHFSGLLKPASLGHNTISPWSKADFISGCIGLRAAAKSYLDKCTVENREALIKTWKADVAEFLLDGDQAADDKHKKFRDGDFHIKYHTAGTYSCYLTT